jgi:hypothetical protein
MSAEREALIYARLLEQWQTAVAQYTDAVLVGIKYRVIGIDLLGARGEKTLRYTREELVRKVVNPPLNCSEEELEQELDWLTSTLLVTKRPGSFLFEAARFISCSECPGTIVRLGVRFSRDSNDQEIQELGANQIPPI